MLCPLSKGVVTMEGVTPSYIFHILPPSSSMPSLTKPHQPSTSTTSQVAASTCHLTLLIAHTEELVFLLVFELERDKALPLSLDAARLDLGSGISVSPDSEAGLLSPGTVPESSCQRWKLKRKVRIQPKLPCRAGRILGITITNR